MDISSFQQALFRIEEAVVVEAEDMELLSRRLHAGDHDNDSHLYITNPRTAF